MKKFASVFAKRMAKTATPQTCQKCSCTANVEGVPGLRCTPCYYPAMPFSTYVSFYNVFILHIVLTQYVVSVF